MDFISQLPSIIGYPLYLLICIGLGYWNKTKGYNFWSGFAIAFLFTPVIGFFIILFYKKKESLIDKIE